MAHAASQLIEAAPGVHRVRLSWSNAYVLSGPGDFALVDAGTPWDGRRLTRALEAFGGVARCRLILLTHAHPDHAGCAALVSRASGAPIAAHEAERPFIEAGSTYGAGQPLASRAAFRLGRAAWRVRRASIGRALGEGESVETPAGEWQVLHTPGHTRGHMAFWRERDGVLISGDALLTILPWTRRAGLTLPLPIFTRDADVARASALRLARLRPRVLLPGHGEPLIDGVRALQVLEAGLERASRASAST